MKTRLKTNKQRSSYQLDVIDKGEFKIHYFDNVQEAIDYQYKITKQ